MSFNNNFNKGVINELGDRHISVMEIAFPLGQDPETSEENEIPSTSLVGLWSLMERIRRIDTLHLVGSPLLSLYPVLIWAA